MAADSQTTSVASAPNRAIPIPSSDFASAASTRGVLVMPYGFTGLIVCVAAFLLVVVGLGVLAQWFATAAREIKGNQNRLAGCDICSFNLNAICILDDDGSGGGICGGSSTVSCETDADCPPDPGRYGGTNASGHQLTFRDAAAPGGVSGRTQAALAGGDDTTPMMGFSSYYNQADNVIDRPDGLSVDGPTSLLTDPTGLNGEMVYMNDSAKSLASLKQALPARASSGPALVAGGANLTNVLEVGSGSLVVGASSETVVMAAGDVTVTSNVEVGNGLQISDGGYVDQSTTATTPSSPATVLYSGTSFSAGAVEFGETLMDAKGNTSLLGSGIYAGSASFTGDAGGTVTQNCSLGTGDLQWECSAVCASGGDACAADEAYCTSDASFLAFVASLSTDGSATTVTASGCSCVLTSGTDVFASMQYYDQAFGEGGELWGCVGEYFDDADERQEACFPVAPSTSRWVAATTGQTSIYGTNKTVPETVTTHSRGPNAISAAGGVDVTGETMIDCGTETCIDTYYNTAANECSNDTCFFAADSADDTTASAYMKTAGFPPYRGQVRTQGGGSTWGVYSAPDGPVDTSGECTSGGDDDGNYLVEQCGNSAYPPADGVGGTNVHTPEWPYGCVEFDPATGNACIGGDLTMTLGAADRLWNENTKRWELAWYNRDSSPGASVCDFKGPNDAAIPTSVPGISKHVPDRCYSRFRFMSPDVTP